MQLQFWRFSELISHELLGGWSILGDRILYTSSVGRCCFFENSAPAVYEIVGALGAGFLYTAGLNCQKKGSTELSATESAILNRE